MEKMELKLRNFGLRNGINEIIGITFGKWTNTAPLGIIVEDEEGINAKVRLYSNHTRDNIKEKKELWVNVIHDPVIFAICSFDDLDESYFESLNPPIIRGSLSWCRMKAEIKGAYAEVELIDGGVLRKEAKAVNRGFNAIVEALVYGTRLMEYKNMALKEKVDYYLKLAEKCGGEREKRAVEIIKERISELVD